MSSVSDVDSFERHHGIILPEDYRSYLLRKDFRPGRLVSLLEDWCQPYSEKEVGHHFLSTPFPHSVAWNDSVLLSQGKGWSSPYYSPDLFRGAIRMGNLGDEEYSLLVVTGPERGRVWIDARVSRGAGIYPLLSEKGLGTDFKTYLTLSAAGH